MKRLFLAYLFISTSPVLCECRREGYGLVYNCGTDKDIVQFKSYFFDPIVPTLGKPFKAKAVIKIKENVDKDTTFTAIFKRTDISPPFGVKEIYRITDSVCLLLRLGNKGCPPKKGALILDFGELYFLKLLSAGNYTCDLFSETKNKKKVMNLRLDYNITDTISAS